MTRRRVAGRHCMAGAAGATGCGAGGAGLGAGRVAACWGRRGGVGAGLASGFVSALTSGGMPGAGFMMLTGGIEAAEGKSYLADSGVATGAGAAGVEPVTIFPAPSATGS